MQAIILTQINVLRTQKKRLAYALLSLFMLFAVMMPATVAVAAPKDDVCEGVALTGGSCGAPATAEKTVGDTIKNVINILSIIVGIAAVIMIIIGGLQYILSGGDSQKTGTAKNTILYAVIGLAIVAVSQVLVNFVINRVTKVIP